VPHTHPPSSISIQKSLSKPHPNPTSHPHRSFRPRTPLGMTNVESLGWVCSWVLFSSRGLHSIPSIEFFLILFYSIFCRKVRLLYCLLLASRRFSAPSCQVANFSKLPACEHVSLEDWSAQVSWLYVGPLPIPLPPFPLTKTQTRR